MLGEAVRGGLPEPSFYSLGGMEQARAYLRGDVPRPPLCHLVGYRVTQVGSGSATMTMSASPWLRYGEGTIDVKILIDEALAAAVLTGAPPATRVVTSGISTSYFRPSTLESESFVARARVLNSGSTFTVAEVLVEDAVGRATAHATGSLLLRSIRPAPPSTAASSPLRNQPTRRPIPT